MVITAPFIIGMMCAGIFGWAFGSFVETYTGKLNRAAYVLIAILSVLLIWAFKNN